MQHVAEVRFWGGGAGWVHMVTLVKGVMKVFLLEQVDNEQKYINEYDGESWNGE